MKVRALNLGFKAADGKHHTLKLNNVSTNLDESKLREAMNKLVELDMFQDKFGTKLGSTISVVGNRENLLLKQFFYIMASKKGFPSPTPLRIRKENLLWIIIQKFY